jgi:hypothetical protein
VKQPTHTRKVLEFLIKTDDFATVAQVMLGTGSSYNQVAATLHHLRNRHAIDCLAADGQLWWYATPENDNRMRKVAEREPEPPGNRNRRKRVKKTA